MGSPTRPPLALSLAGFQFTYRNSYFDWRLLHGIDVDNVVSWPPFMLLAADWLPQGASSFCTLIGEDARHIHSSSTVAHNQTPALPT